jgi:hypothetical protein
MLLSQTDRRPYYCDPHYNYDPNKLSSTQFKSWAEDGRWQSKMTEYYAQAISFTIKGMRAKYVVPEKDARDNDGFLKLGRKTYPVSFKTLTTKVLYQCSRFVGGSRSCSIKDLIYSLKQADFTIVCDIRPMGLWTYWMIENEMLLAEVKDGYLNGNGHQRHEFFTFLENYGYIQQELGVLVG